MTQSSQHSLPCNGLTAALLTPVGRGAVATIRVVGHVSTTNTECSGTDAGTHQPILKSPFVKIDSLFRAANGLQISDLPIHKIAFGQWGRSGVEDLVICRFAQDVLEIHCHGGDAAVQRVLDDLASAHCAVVDWKAQVASIGNIVDAECAEVLSRTTTWRTTEIAMEQANGILQATFSRLKMSHAETEANIVSELDNLLRWSDFGLHLSTPWSLVLTGRPNVGKSSLINALLGYQRAIVFDEPGTTRDVVTGETAFDGWPVVLADTAGMRGGAGELEAAGIALARERLRTADLRLVLIDVSQFPTLDDDELLAQWPEALIVAHKSDLPNQWGDHLPTGAVMVSSVTGEGLIELERQLVNRLVPEVPRPGTPIPITVRQVEILRAARKTSTTEDRHQAIEQL